jgi:hypothetical protein
MRVSWSAVAVAVLLAGCSSGDDETTLQPLPIQGGTAAASPTILVTAPPTAPSTSTTTAVPGSVAADADGDWDGARFDVGTVSARTKVGALDAISFDRLTYHAPDGTSYDASNLASEPLVAWWRTSPFTNVQVRDRTFVLAPGVEVLVVDPAGRAAACTDPPPAAPPAPSWKPADVSALSDPANAGDIASLTYSATGQVVRIRLTRGC